jgi:hypothetical protein
MELTGQVKRITLIPVVGGEPIELKPLDFTPITRSISDLRAAFDLAAKKAMKLSFTINRLPRKVRLALLQLSGFKKAPRFTYKTKKQYGYAKRNRR